MSQFPFEPGERVLPSIGLIGAGPVGTLIAAALHFNRAPFHWVVRSPERREELEQLRLDIRLRENSELPGPDSHRRFELPLDRITMLESSGELPWLQWLILCVKAQQVEPLLQELAPTASTEVLVIANGLHTGPFHLGILFGGAYLQDGWLCSTQDNELVIGELGMGWQADESIDLLAPLDAPFLHVITDSHLEERMWMKAALNCVINPLTATLDCANGHLLKLLDKPVVTGLLQELRAVVAVCAPLSERLRMADLRSDLRELLEVTAGNSSSMREDLRHGRQTEIRQLNLAVAAAGEAHGIPCPRLRALGEEVLKLEQEGSKH